MAARGMGAIVPATGATGMAPIAAVGGKANSPIGRVCLRLCHLASCFEIGHHLSSCIYSSSACHEVWCHVLHELPAARWTPRFRPKVLVVCDITDVSISYPQGLAAVILLAVCVLSASVRLFSVIKYESVIHEFDPYFNYRVTVFLTKVRFCRPLTLMHHGALSRCSDACRHLMAMRETCRKASTTCGTGLTTRHGTHWAAS